MNQMRKHRSRPLRTGAVMAAAVMLGIIDGYGKANMYKVNKILKRRIRDGFVEKEKLGKGGRTSPTNYRAIVSLGAKDRAKFAEPK